MYVAMTCQNPPLDPLEEWSGPMSGEIPCVAGAKLQTSFFLSLLPNTLYRFRCRAINSIGASAWSLPSAPGRTLVCVPDTPAVPTLIDAI